MKVKYAVPWKLVRVLGVCKIALCTFVCGLIVTSCASSVRFSAVERLDGERVASTVATSKKVAKHSRTGKSKKNLPAVGTTFRGKASFYADKFHGRTTANGETFDKNELTAAHKTLPFNTVVEVKNLYNGKTVLVRINDRGPFVEGRIIDLSLRAAREISMEKAGVVPIEMKIVAHNPHM